MKANRRSIESVSSSVKTRPERGAQAPAAGDRVTALDWKQIERELDERGYALTDRLLTADECADLIALYENRERFRSRVDMARFRYGEGEYKYFSYPLPTIVAELRTALYRGLAPIANRWSKALSEREQYPRSLTEYLKDCHCAGQNRPTPLLLRYQAGGYNCLHQDLYGEMAFPLQFTCLLSRKGHDYEGGESLLVEQRPRAQSRGEAIAIEQGCALIFPNRYRPVAGSRGHYRAAVRHGVSTVRSGTRHALGIIFHDAK
jgi:hypothetical protein